MSGTRPSSALSPIASSSLGWGRLRDRKQPCLGYSSSLFKYIYKTILITFEPPGIAVHFIVITETLAPTSLMRQHNNKHGCGDNDRNKDEKQHQPNQYLQYYAHNKWILGPQRYNILTKPKVFYWLNSIKCTSPQPCSSKLAWRSACSIFDHKGCQVSLRGTQ